MIGVAFAMHETFGATNGIERTAFERVLHDYARQREWSIDAATAERMSRLAAADFASPQTLTSAFSTVLGATLWRDADAVGLEALFRMTAARAAVERFVPYDDVAPALGRLAKMRVPRVGLSRGWPPIDARIADGVGFDGTIVFAQDLGIDASTPQAFARVTDALRLPAERIWFIGSDALAEIVPAAAAGLRTIWVNRDAAQFPAGRLAPDAVIVSFDGLFDVLTEPYTRGLLALRHIMRTALDWRPGHFIPGDESNVLGEPLAKPEDTP